MATDPIYPGNGVAIVKDEIVAADGAVTRYYALDHNKFTSINVSKDGETVTIEVTNDLLDAAGDKLTDLEDASVVWNSRSSDTTDYLAGDSSGLTGVKISTAGAVTNDVDYSIIQYMKR